MRTLRVVFITAIAALFAGQHISAQALTYQLFERNLESLRQQSAIPGLSAAIVQNGDILWDSGLGHSDVEGNLFPTSYTPYVLGSLSGVFSSTLLLDRCIDDSYLRPSDPVIRWSPAFPDALSTVGELLAHATATGAFHYDTARYAALTTVIEQCAHSSSFRKLLANDILDQFAMSTGSAPGPDLAMPTTDDRALFSPAVLAHYQAVIAQLAVPYQVDSRGRATRSTVAGQSLDASQGVISNIDDLRRFDRVFTDETLTPATRALATTNALGGDGAPLPTGLGWFVQPYDGETLVWQFGVVNGAYSALYLHLQNHNVSLILLANSDGLSAPFGLEKGDVTASPFAKLFLKAFGI